MSANCGVADLLRSSGPVRVPLSECCAAALFGVDAPTRCAALPLRRPLENLGKAESLGAARSLLGAVEQAADQGDRVQARP